MSAETFFGGAVQLADLPPGNPAPFPVLKQVRPRSSSLGAAAQYIEHCHHYDRSVPALRIDAGAIAEHDSPAVASTAHSDMPGLWRSSSKKDHGVGAGGAGAGAGGGVQGARQKITKEGRERRLSSAGVLQHLRLSSPATPKQPEGNLHQLQERARSKTAEGSVNKAMSIESSNFSTCNKTSQEVGITQFIAETAVLPNDSGVAVPPLYASLEGEQGGRSSEEDEAVTEQRARAYAALTGSRPSPGNTAARIRATSMLTRATAASPIGSVSQNSALVPIRPAVASSAIPRRRTTSSNDAPTMAERSSKSALPPMSGVFNGSPANAGNKTRRSRVQSANAGPSASSSAMSPSADASSPSPAATRRKRRSLSQENSLVATRLARAFLARELGESAFSRRPASAPRESWSTDESEQRELWLSLHDGVILCRLLNQLVPHAVKHIDGRDVSSAKTANISNFLTAAKTHLPLQPHEFFEVSQLYSGLPNGFERVLHTICAIAECVTLQRHASLDASKSSESLLASPLLATMGSPPLPSPPASFSASTDSPSALGYSPHMRATSPMSICDDDRPNSAVSASSPSLSTSGSRSAKALSSSAGLRVRSRTGSRATETGPVSPPAVSAVTAVSGPLSGAVDGKRGSSVTFASPSSHMEQLHFARKANAHHGVYGNNPDRRMSESAVEIMTVLREGEEMPSPRRAASDRPNSAGAMSKTASDSDCTPVKRMKEALKSGQAELDIGGGATGQSSREVRPAGLPVPVRQSRSRHHSASSTGSGSPASAADMMGLRTSPRLVRKRFSWASATSATERAGTPSRATSVSPTPSAFSEGASTPTHIPFPKGTSSVIRAKSIVAPRRASDIPRLSIEPETDGDEDEHSPSPLRESALATSQPPRAIKANLSPTSSPPVRPRQHKRWNSEVYDQTVGGSRLRQDPLALRSRHDSFMPPSNSGQYSPSILPNRGDAASPANDLRRRSTDKRQSLDGSRQRLVVKEPGKSAITYQLGECIGRGQFGSVYRALNIHTGSVVAVKRIRVDGKSEEEITQLQREVNLLKSLSHPSVVKYEGLVRTEHAINIVLEYVENGSLQHTLAAFGILPEPLVASYVVKILEGLVYLHSVHVIHRDLKAANILTTKNGNIKLSDFGVSLQLNAVYNTIENADATGTPNWMAPEVIKLERATYASDIWSLACTVIELLTGKPPYSNLLAMTAMFKIVEDDMPPLPDNCSPELEDFLQLCFAKQPEDRPTAEMLYEHAWLRKYWLAQKQNLRPQDSIPFIRRVSSEYPRRPAFAREASSTSEVPDLDRSISSPGNSSLLSDEVASPLLRAYDPVVIDSLGRSSVSAPTEHDVDLLTSQLLQTSKDVSTPREMAFSVPDAYPFPRTATPVSAQMPGSATGPAHSFVKTTFSKPIDCRICHQQVRKYAVLCEECGLICHAKCKEFAPVPCDLRSQLLGFAPMPRATPISIPGSVTSPALACSVPLVEPSPLASPSQYAYHPRFGISRKPKGSPNEPPLPSEPVGRTKGLALLRSRTSSPDRFGLPLRPRPASYASSSSLTRSREGNASSISGSSDSHPLSASSIPEDMAVEAPVARAETTEGSNNLPLGKALLARRSFSGGKPPRPAKVKHGKKESSGDCIIS